MTERRTSNVRLPLELRSNRRETSATRVSDDLQISIFRRRKICFGNIFGFFYGFSLFSGDFRGARFFLTSKSSSSRFFALDGQIFRSVQRLELIFRFFTVRTSTFKTAPPHEKIRRPYRPMWCLLGEVSSWEDHRLLLVLLGSLVSWLSESPQPFCK